MLYVHVACTTTAGFLLFPHKASCLFLYIIFRLQCAMTMLLKRAALIKRSARTYFSLSPSHLDTRSEEEMEKKVELLASVATALAKYDFPVPGGPKSKIPLHGVLFPGSERL